MSDINNVLRLNADFRFPVMDAGADFSGEDLADDMEGLSFSFQRIKIPAGGALQFELPGENPEDPEYIRTIEGVIFYNHASNALWSEGSQDDENATPICSSVDGRIGVGDPGKDCATCAFNKFGSGEGGRGKACKNTRVLYLLRDGEYMPIQVILPPTSIKPFSDFYNLAFASRRRAAYGSLVSIGLKRMSNGKDDYSVATFKKLHDFSGEQLAQSKAYSEGFKAQIKLINQRRAADAIDRSIDDLDGYLDGESIYANDPRFPNADHDTVIDGNRERLPA